MKPLSELLHLQATHPNPVTRSVYRTILGNRLDALEIGLSPSRKTRKTSDENGQCTIHCKKK